MHYLRQGRGFYRSAIALMLPMILQNLVTNFMALADSFMVGALGETELAAVTMANSVFYVLSLIISASRAARACSWLSTTARAGSTR